jgi:phytoene dehydrogenase-like protein
MRTNIWRIEFVPAVTPWEWNATITLPEWKQFTTDEDDLNPNVKEGWKKFVDALAGHEKIHKEKWEQYVRAYQSRVDEFAKTRFFGEAADTKNRTAMTSAWNDAKRLFDKQREKLHADLKALTAAYNEDQKLYDEISDHGRNQESYDPAGKNIEAVNNGLKLKR